MMLGVPAVPSLALAIFMLKLVESPRWLVMQGRVGEARRVLLLVSNTKEEAEQQLKGIKVVVGIDENCALDIVQVPRKICSGGGALKELFCKPSPPITYAGHTLNTNLRDCVQKDSLQFKGCFKGNCWIRGVWGSRSQICETSDPRGRQQLTWMEAG
ncbi:hypothetical protein Fmac_002494 [Flemingia macrophylla]|uniref:Uncharacterized protein n=1 Tax=Flemingia macrophylla TaxID=520843 RepID=A0ABD1NK30_9FABA